MAFADADDLATRLGVSFTTPEQTQANAILGDATAWLQSEIGQLIESGSSTFTLRVDPCDRRIRLPQWPVVGVTSVTVNGTAITDYELADGCLYRECGWPPAPGDQFCVVVIDFDYGFAEIPGVLVTWCLVLAAGILAQIKRSGSLAASGITSERIDDYAVSYDPSATTFALPERQLERLRAQFGQGVYVTGSR